MAIESRRRHTIFRATRRTLLPRGISMQDSPPTDDVPEAAMASDVLRSMPRRKISDDVVSTTVTLPRARQVHFDAGTVRPLLRLLVWLGCAIRFYCGHSFRLGDASGQH